MYNIVPARHFSLIKPYTFQKLTRKVRSERWETYTRIFAMRWETENNEVGNGHMRRETDAWGGKRLLETSEKKSTILIAYSPHIFSCTSNLFFCEYTSTAPLHVNCHSWRSLLSYWESIFTVQVNQNYALLTWNLYEMGCALQTSQIM